MTKFFERWFATIHALVMIVGLSVRRDYDAGWADLREWHDR